LTKIHHECQICVGMDLWMDDQNATGNKMKTNTTSWEQ